MSTPRRIAVVGTTGSGKTTVAAAIADRLGYAHVELDGIHHQENWTPIERDEMRRVVGRRTETDTWVIDGNYHGMVQDLVFGAADTVVWLDLPRSTVMAQITRRSVGRVVLRKELWNGNRERLRSLFNTTPEDNVILWAWTRHRPLRRRYAAAMADPANSHLQWVRLTSRRSTENWLGTLE